MNRNNLKKIFKPEKTTTRYGTITSRISAKRFKLTDDNDLEFIANATKDWGLGTQVIVQNGYIIGTGKRSGTYKHFKL
jgi:hypothetical protein